MHHTFLGKVGEKYKDFIVAKVVPIPELQATLREIIHIPSGAEIMHLANDDPENLFCLSFKTLPNSSNGAAHILEHTVLCGSRKYPIKDPFSAMNRRSLNTFMNALTGSDFTCYPASSQVEKDFYNLLEVYQDAVFHPLLKELSFLQEGHRFEFTTPNDPSSPLIISGIVYNEMKGSMSSIDSRVWHRMMENLFPDLPYAFNSGGEPKEIPSLTYAQLIEFYETYYHPSRCLFFFYGNLPLKKHLDNILEHTLKNVPMLPPLHPIPKQKRFQTARKKEYLYPIQEKEELGKKHIICFGWLTAPLLNHEDVLALSILDSVLMDTDSSLLKKTLLDSDLCVKADSYIDIEMSEVPYIVICRGCKKEDAEELEKLFFARLQEIMEGKIPFRLIEAAIDHLEFARTEILKDQSPFGLTLFMRCALAKQHGAPPENALTMHSLFSNLLKKAKDPDYLRHIVKKYLLDNPHFVRLTFIPDPELISKENQEELERLEKIQASLTDKQKAKILDQTEELAKFQQTLEKQNLSCLPKVTLQDVTAATRDFSLIEQKAGTLTIFRHECFTNHILYTELIFDFPQIAEEDLFYVQLFVSLFSEVGAAGRSYGKNLELLHAHTGGIRASCSLYVPVTDPKKVVPTLHIRGKALQRKIPQFFKLMREMVVSIRLNEKKRIGDLINQMATSLEGNLTRNAMKYATLLATSGLSEAAHINELWTGISFYQRIQKIAANLKKELPLVMEKLQMISEKLLCVNQPHLVLSTDQEMYRQIEEEAFYGLTELPLKVASRWENKTHLKKIPSQARPISSAVAFTVEAFNTIGYLHQDSPALLAATLLLENKVLHQRIRERGGAYGTGANYNSLWGNFYFYSYRDPHIAHTLRTFHDALDSLAKGDFDAVDLEEAKLGIIQQLDHPISPGSTAMVAYSWMRDGKSHAMRQHYRDRLLNLNVLEMSLALEHHLSPNKKHSTIVTFAGEELIEKENKLLSTSQSPLPIHPI